jgi:hypothetical protein
MKALFSLPDIARIPFFTNGTAMKQFQFAVSMEIVVKGLAR